MSTFILPPDKHIVWRGSLEKPSYVEFYVEASDRVSTYLVEEEGYDNFLEGKDVEPSFGGFVNRTRHHQKLWLGFSGAYHLLIVNEGDHDVAVHYEIPI